QWQAIDKRPPEKPGPGAREAAQRHGRVALALLGPAWVDDRAARTEAGGTMKLSYKELQHFVGSPKPEWWLSLGEAGEQIGRHWQALAKRVDDRTEKAAGKSLDLALKDLAQADTLARSLDSATALADKHDPVTDYRRHRLHAFLLDQARRTI